MIKQSLVQEKIADLTAMNQLPPLSTLPQWSRINTLDRGRYPKPFVKDKHQPMDNKKDSDEEDKEINLNELNPAQRIHHLERSILFLKQQHQDVLRSLHEEIESLKKENKDLHFKIVMSQKAQQEKQSAEGQDTAKRGNTRIEKDDRLDELKIIFLEEEIKELKHAIRDLRTRNTFLSQRLEQEEDVKKKQQAKIEGLEFQLSQSGGVLSEQLSPANLNPFNNPAGPPTLGECEVIIRHLQAINEKQSHELDRLKSDLRDVLYSHKWTPDAYLLAKAYIAEDDAKDKEKTGLPKLPLKNPSRKLPDLAYIQRDTVNLPALKQTVSNKAIERRKRSQILQKARLHKEVIP